MDEGLATLVAMIPNLAVALWVIYNDRKRMDKQDELLKSVIDKLMALHPPQDEEVPSSKGR